MATDIEYGIDLSAEPGSWNGIWKYIDNFGQATTLYITDVHSPVEPAVGRAARGKTLEKENRELDEENSELYLELTDGHK